MAVGALSIVDTLSLGDLMVLFQQNGATYSASTIQTLLTLLKANISNGGFTKQYSSPTATGFTVVLTTGSLDIYLILTPLAGYAAGAFTLPLASTCVDGQRVLINSTQIVTTVTYNLNGAASVVGGLTTFAAANAFETLTFDKPSSIWYRTA
jgi:hypothetical protein